MTAPRIQSFYDMIEKNPCAIGMLTSSIDPAMAEIAGYGGFDYVVMDNEHSPIGPERCVDMVRAAESAGILPMVRLVSADPILISKFLDSGVRGIVVPHCESAEKVRAAIAATQYKPHGTRGWCPSNHLAHYSIDYYKNHSEELASTLAVLPIIESPEGLEAADEILQIPEIKMVYFGPGDYSHHVGHAGQSLRSPIVAEAGRKLLELGKKHNKMIGVFPNEFNAAAGIRCREAGYGAQLYGVDLNFVIEMYTNLTSALKK